LGYWIFSQHNRITPFIFPLGFWRVIHDNWASTVQGGVLRIKSYYILLYI
jgi:hypothetical protein